MNVAALQQVIPELNIKNNSVYPAAIKEYFEFYNIDFENHIAGVQHHFGYITCEPYRIACHFYAFNDKPLAANKKTLLIVHGYYDHSGLYGHAIANALRLGYQVIVFDLPGHGLSSGERAGIQRFVEYQDVVKKIIEVFTQENCKLSAMLGQSTGGAIVMQYLLEHPANTLKAVLLAPLVRPCRWGMSKISYSLAHKFIKTVPRSFANNSQDQQFLAFVKNRDPLQTKRTALTWVAALIEWQQEFKYFKANKSKVYIVQGRADKTVDWQYNIPAIVKKLPAANVQYVDDAGHQLVNESEPLRQQIFIGINQFLQQEA